jgi:hypothetical protein
MRPTALNFVKMYPPITKNVPTMIKPGQGRVVGGEIFEGKVADC